MTSRAKLLIGPAGWDYEDWRGIVYPAKRPQGFRPLPCLANWFNLVEINSTYYHIPSVQRAASWCEQVREHENFQFTAKLWQGFTHDGVYTDNDIAAFRAFADRLASEGRLACLLAQFPWSFKHNPGNLEYLERLLRHFAELPLALEIRHDSWLKDDNVLQLCAERSIAFCNIDQPQLNRCLKPSNHLTAPVAYVRLHGRNAANWFNENASVASRYDYLYQDEELAEWAARLQSIIEKAAKVIVVANNHFRGKAVANALELRGKFEKLDLRLPASLIQTYPELARLPGVTAEQDERQLELF